jgi:hypothetical protein
MSAPGRLSRRQRRVLIASKALLALLLLVGALFPNVGGFAGKGMAYRLPLFMLPALAVPLWWRRDRGRPYPFALDLALTVPFLLDTAANAFGVYDHWTHTDDVLHVVNWVVLLWGVTTHFVAMTPSSPRWLLWTAGFGLGAVVSVAWEVAEYAVMRAGVGGLTLTYADTLSDLVLSTLGGGLGAWLAIRRRPILVDA